MVLELIDEIHKAFNKRENLLGIFFDLSKVFDYVDPKILLNKLYFYGIEGKNIDWFKSYLANRKQYVDYVNRKEKSDLSIITCDVPQGSILGPLFFVI